MEHDDIETGFTTFSNSTMDICEFSTKVIILKLLNGSLFKAKSDPTFRFALL
jgi:hypothetical protein